MCVIGDRNSALEADILDRDRQAGARVVDQPRQPGDQRVEHIRGRGGRRRVRLRHHGRRHGGEHRRVGGRVHFGLETRRGPIIDAHADDENQRHHHQAEHHGDVGAAVTEEIAKIGGGHGGPLATKRQCSRRGGTGLQIAARPAAALPPRAGRACQSCVEALSRLERTASRRARELAAFSAHEEREFVPQPQQGDD